MKIRITITFILLTINIILAQEYGQKNDLEFLSDTKANSKSNIYKAYFTEIRLSNNLVFQQEMLSRSTSDYTIIEIPLVLKYALTKKLGFLIGPKVDVINNGFYNEKNVSVYSTMGIQYEVSKSLLLEARFNYRFTNESPIKTDYTFGSKASFTLGSKLKF